MRNRPVTGRLPSENVVMHAFGDFFISLFEQVVEQLNYQQRFKTPTPTWRHSNTKDGSGDIQAFHTFVFVAVGLCLTLPKFVSIITQLQ